MRYISLFILALLSSAPSKAALWTIDVSGFFYASVYEVEFTCADMSCLKTRSFVDPIAINRQVTVPSNFSSYSFYISPFGFGYDFDPRSAIAVNLLHVGSIVRAESSGSFFTRNTGNCVPASQGPCINRSVIGGSSQFSATFIGSDDGTAPVPEPTIWAMMIGGFGLIGGIQRMRRRVSAMRLPVAGVAST